MKRVVTFLLAAGLAFAVAAPASAASPSAPSTPARAAAAWLANRVNPSGFIPLAADPNSPDFGTSAQAVTALAAAGIGRAKVDALLGYLGSHVDDDVVSGGADAPGALAYLILAAKAASLDPTSFGPAHVDLVARLVATQRPDGLFGAADPSFDGTYRQGLALVALHAAGVANAPGATWLAGQQCADGSYAAFRADTSAPCPPIDLVTFTGPDTNSTALAVLGLDAQGDTDAAAAGVAALDSARNASGGWGFFVSADQATDANSTAVVLDALRTVNGAVDGPGRAALAALQVGCGAAPADRGGVAFQPDAHGRLIPDAFATVQAVPALAGVALPITSATITAGVPDPCPSAVATTTTTVATTGTTATAPATTVAATAVAQLPRTGSAPGLLGAAGVLLLALGAVFLGGARRRRR